MNDQSPIRAEVTPVASRPVPAASPARTLPRLGVVIVAFNSGDVIVECLESLLASTEVDLSIVVVDNNSTDGTVRRLRHWASGESTYVPSADLPFGLRPAPKPVRMAETHRPVPFPAQAQVLLVHAGVNGGYAAGVNAGLACLTATPGIDRFWILNPDSAAAPGAALAFATAGGPNARFAIMGGRLNYMHRPDRIQIDGGRINWRTGVTSNLNQGAIDADCPAPDPRQMDFVSGASMVVSRAFYERAGPMPEDYFLYYEEVDWALRRGDLPLAYCEGAVVYHRAGTAIGSPLPGSVGSPMSIYFKHRNRLRFLRRYRRHAWLTAQAFSLAKAAQVMLKGHPREAWVLILASFGRPPTRDVRRRLAPDAARLAFGGNR